MIPALSLLIVHRSSNILLIVLVAIRQKNFIFQTLELTTEIEVKKIRFQTLRFSVDIYSFNISPVLINGQNAEHHPNNLKKKEDRV